jgi:hypothetical protein
MLKRGFGFPMILCGFVAALSAFCSSADELDLAGDWRVRIDEADEGLARKCFAKPIQDSNAG